MRHVETYAICPIFFVNLEKNWIPELSRKAFTHLLRHLINWRKRGWFAGELPPQQKCSELHVGKCSLVSDIFHIQTHQKMSKNQQTSHKSHFIFTVCFKKGFQQRIVRVQFQKRDTGQNFITYKTQTTIFLFNLSKHAHMNSLSWKTLKLPPFGGLFSIHWDVLFR